MASKFTGSMLGLIGINLVGALFCILSLFIALPWAVCMKQRWLAQNTIIDGKQLNFVGDGGALFGKYIVWLILTVVTFGIYGFWLRIKMRRWIVNNTHFA